jgi:protein O-GlcNAc transferase
MPISPIEDLLQRALTLHRSGATAEAAAGYSEVLRADPANADAHYYLAMISCHQGCFAEGAELARKSLVGNPRHSRAYVLLGRALNALEQHEEALASFERAIALAPDLAQAHGNRADVLSQLGRNAEAIHSYDRALSLAPDSTKDWFNRGVLLVAVGQLGEAVASFDRVVTGTADFAQAQLWRAKVLSDLHRDDEALESIRAALEAEPDLAEAWLGQANLLEKLDRYEEGLAALDRAVELKPDLAEAWIGRGNIFNRQNRYDEAFAAYDRALAIKSNLGEGWLGRGNVFSRLKQYEEAAAAYEKALLLKPDLAEAWLGRGNVFTEFRRYDEAFAAYDKAVSLKPYLNYVAGARLSSKLLICDWTDLDAEVERLLATVRDGKPASTPFTILGVPSTPADQLQCAASFVQDQPSFAAMWRGEIYSHTRIRVAYLSADFHDSAMGNLLAGLFEQHDRSRFEVSAISFGPEQNSPMRNRLKKAFEHFIDVRQESDQEIADLVRRLEVDIAVDLMGFTKSNRLNVLARRPAPIQVNYLGYPGTMGAGYMDYILADPTVIPDDQRAFYREAVVRVPESYFVNDNRRVISEHTPTRRECGLPDKGFVFCCFNNSYKITPKMFDVWMRLLKATENSVLWLFQASSAAAANLRWEAERRGVSPDRLIFARKADAADHLARHRLADLVIDTLPYNAHTTACDALWVGVPVLTCIGTTFVGRVAASLLKASGLDELITQSVGEYEALALKLARDSSFLASFAERIAQNRNRCALFDTERSARHFEAAYRAMWERYQRGDMARVSNGSSLTPIHIV